MGGPHTRSQGDVPHDHEHRTTQRQSGIPPGRGGVGGSRGRPQAGVHLEYTPGYGETPPCRASEAAEDPPRWPLGAHCALQCFLPLEGRVLFKDRGPGAAFVGDKGGFRFNDSTGVGRLPRSRLKIESPTSREGGSGTCVARAGSPGVASQAAGAAPRVFPWLAGFRQGRPLSSG
jgi:hypothetical protein